MCIWLPKLLSLILKRVLDKWGFSQKRPNNSGSLRIVAKSWHCTSACLIPAFNLLWRPNSVLKHNVYYTYFYLVPMAREGSDQQSYSPRVRLKGGPSQTTAYDLKVTYCKVSALCTICTKDTQNTLQKEKDCAWLTSKIYVKWHKHVRPMCVWRHLKTFTNVLDTCTWANFPSESDQSMAWFDF